jgi:tetratricopeptide (TPR) repeat protein
MTAYHSKLCAALLAGIVLFPLPAAAEPSYSTAESATDPNFVAARKAIDAKDWKKAIEFLDKVQLVGSNGKRNARLSADVFNLLGFAYRQSGNYDEAFRHYKEALRIDAWHLGTHAYIGEAYLKTNNLPKAEEHLAELRRLCGERCEEYRKLAQEVAAYRNTRVTQQEVK